MSTTRSITYLHEGLGIKKQMEVRREELLDHLTFTKNKRPIFTEIFGPIIGLKQEWEAQGATPEELDLSAFHFQTYRDYFIPVNTGWMGGPEPTITLDDNEKMIGTDQYGRTVKLVKSSASIPMPMDYPVKNMEDWLKIKSHYEFSEERFTANWEADTKARIAAGEVTIAHIPGGFDEPRQLMGEEEVCVSFYTQPELIKDIIDTIATTAYKVLDRVSAAVPIDILFSHEDMAGKSGPLIGPDHITEFIKPYYRKIWDLLSSRNTRIFSQDSDGNMNPVLDAFLDAGINHMFPCEPAAGMDIVALREKYGTRISFEGGLDKHVLRKGPEAITQELEYKLPPMIKSGGCVLGLDHRIPNGTSLENYKFYIKKAWEIIERETKANA